MKKPLKLALLALLAPPAFGGGAIFAQTKAAEAPKAGLELATFAGGCFWCMVPPFEKLEGVSEVLSGYTGGSTEHPSYQQVSSGSTGHAEAVRVTFDPKKISYEKLLDTYWHQIDPTTPNQSFVDYGTQYRSAIFYHSEAQKKAAEASKAELDKSKRFGAPIVTQIQPAPTFWVAEDYHQDYYKKNPVRYEFYHYHSGRDQYLDRIWGKGKH